jgi:hypothetical protein
MLASQPQSQREATQNAQLSAALQQVEMDVIGFLQKLKDSKPPELERKPMSEDLLPFFEKYAWSAIEILFKDRILAVSSVDEARSLIKKSVDLVTNKICKRGVVQDDDVVSGGVWWMTVGQACKAVSLELVA